MKNPVYLDFGIYEIEYEPKNYLSVLDRFNIAKCARQRMSEYVVDAIRWKGERRSFYSTLQAMNVDEVCYND
jgi:hypothetical protein